MQDVAIKQAGDSQSLSSERDWDRDQRQGPLADVLARTAPFRRDTRVGSGLSLSADSVRSLRCKERRCGEVFVRSKRRTSECIAEPVIGDPVIYDPEFALATRGGRD